MLTAVAGLSAFFLVFKLDRWLAGYAPISFPIVTVLFIILIAISYPQLRPWLTNKLDTWLSLAKPQPQQTAAAITQTLSELPDPARLQQQMLNTLCQTLQACQGFVAVAGDDERMTILAVYGSPAARPEDTIWLPHLCSEEPQLKCYLLR